MRHFFIVHRQTITETGTDHGIAPRFRHVSRLSRIFRRLCQLCLQGI